MHASNERILLVENDPEICDFIADQTLLAMGYKVQVVHLVTTALQEVNNFSPDIIMTNLQLPDLSGKDLLVALNSQSINTPVIIIAQKGMVEDIDQAFRLGAADILFWPMREAEIIAALERIIEGTRSIRKLEALGKKLNKINLELQNRVRELTTISAIGKAVTLITNQEDLFEKLVEGSVYASESDRGWLLLIEKPGSAFKLAAQCNLPERIAEQVDPPWDDGISSLVALSGEPLSIYGVPLAQFNISKLGQSAYVMPIKVQSALVGLLILVRKTARHFSTSTRAVLEVVAGYASIYLATASVHRGLEQLYYPGQPTVNAAQNSGIEESKLMSLIHKDITRPVVNSMQSLNHLLVSENARLNSTQKSVLHSVLQNLERISAMIESINEQD